MSRRPPAAVPAPAASPLADRLRDGANQPLASFIFVAPLLLAYELGMVALGPAAMRNGADAWLRWILDHAGFGQYFLLPLLVCFFLLGWHHLSRSAWGVSPGTLLTMLMETCWLSAGLLALAQCPFFGLGPYGAEPSLAVASCDTSHLWGYLGAGIYEELLFRVILLTCFVRLFRSCGESQTISFTLATIASSLIFAAAHYDAFVAGGDDFCWPTFGFRFTAGVVFALVFASRGFGIAAATHTLYDLLTGLLAAWA